MSFHGDRALKDPGRGAGMGEPHFRAALPWPGSLSALSGEGPRHGLSSTEGWASYLAVSVPEQLTTGPGTSSPLSAPATTVHGSPSLRRPSLVPGLRACALTFFTCGLGFSLVVLGGAVA